MRLLVLDIEGTLFRTEIRLPGTSLSSTIWQSLAAALGPEAIADEIATHRTWESGGYRNYIEWMRATLEIHKRHGLTKTTFDQVIEAAVYQPGVQAFFSQLDRDEYTPVLVSGGFRELARRAQMDLGIYHAFTACEYMFNRSGHLASFNLLPCDFDGKVDFINLMLREYGLTGSSWIFVGDGANDAPIAALAPYAIGLNPHEQLRDHTDANVSDFSELQAAIDVLLGGEAE